MLREYHNLVVEMEGTNPRLSTLELEMIKTTILFAAIPIVAALALTGWRSIGAGEASDVGTRPGGVQTKLDSDEAVRAKGHELALFAAG